jgi:hypothetical protein
MVNGDTRTEQVRLSQHSMLRRDWTSPELAPALSPRSSGRSDGSTTVHPAVDMDGAEVRVAVHDGAVKSTTFLSALGRICSNRSFNFDVFLGQQFLS